MKITLFKAFPDSYRQSMAVYADRLSEALHPILKSDEELHTFSLRGAFLAPRLARYCSQYVGYQLQAPFVQGDVNHVIDHSYGHLLHTLDPKRTVVTFHDAIGMKGRNGNFVAEEINRPNNFVRQYNLSGLCKAAAVICVSESSRKDFLSDSGYPSERVEVIYEGVDESFFKAPSEDPKKRFGLKPGNYLLHVGHAGFYKNILALFHVLVILNRSFGKEVKLIKVGTAFTPEQEKLAQKLGVEDRLIHLGMVPDRLMPEVYRSGDVLLFPSLYEGFGFPVLEAMASGVPVVTSNRGSLPEVVGDAGILVDPMDYEAMAKSIVSLLDHPALRTQLREEGLKRARLFTWRKTAERTLNVYRRVFEGCEIR